MNKIIEYIKRQEEEKTELLEEQPVQEEVIEQTPEQKWVEVIKENKKEAVLQQAKSIDSSIVVKEKQKGQYKDITFDDLIDKTEIVKKPTLPIIREEKIKTIHEVLEETFANTIKERKQEQLNQQSNLNIDFKQPFHSERLQKIALVDQINEVLKHRDPILETMTFQEWSKDPFNEIIIGLSDYHADRLYKQDMDRADKVQAAGRASGGVRKKKVTTAAVTYYWTPDLMPSCSLWLDADDASSITLNGTDVSQWDDKSGLGNHYGQAYGAAQPAYSASVINGLYVVATDGGLGYEQYLTRSSTTDYVDSSQHFTTFIVAQQWKDHGGLGTTIGLYFSFGGTSGASYGSYFNHFLTNGSLVRSNYDSDASDIDYTIPGGNAAWQGVNKILTNRSYSSGTELRITGSLALLDPTGNPTINGTGWSGISSYKDNGGDDGSWYFAEIIHYARGLTDTECATVETYLQNKWDITVATQSVDPALGSDNSYTP